MHRLALVLAIITAISTPVFAQKSPLQAELAAIDAQIAEVEGQIAQYKGGMIRGLAEARREALFLARTILRNRIQAEAGHGTIEVVVQATQPNEERANQILGDMAAVQQRIEKAEDEAARAGGLIQALTLSRAETERLNLAQLQMGYLQAKYGIAFPVIQADPAPNLRADEPAPNLAAKRGDSVSWADPRFPEIDYSLQPFEQAHRDGDRVSGWWVIKSERAPVDDSPQITAVNYSAYQPNSYRGFTALIARCIEGQTALILIQDDFLTNAFRRNSFEMTLRIDDNPAQTSRWSSLTNNKGAGLFGRDAEAFIRTIYEADRLFIRLVESNGRQHDGLFQLAGAPDAFEQVASACGWTTLSLSPDDYRAIQTILNTSGLNTGAPDGQWGPSSQAAMRAYQASVGLAETGAPDRATLERLGFGE